MRGKRLYAYSKAGRHTGTKNLGKRGDYVAFSGNRQAGGDMAEMGNGSIRGFVYVIKTLQGDE